MKLLTGRKIVENKLTISKEQARKNLEDFRKDLHIRAWKRVSESKIPDMVKLAMLMSNALEILLEHIDMDIRSELRAMGLKYSPSNADGDILKGMRNYSDKVKAAMYWFERDLQKFITDSTLGTYGVESFDMFNHSSAEVVQLLMLCVDRGETDGAMALTLFSLPLDSNDNNRKSLKVQCFRQRHTRQLLGTTDEYKEEDSYETK